MAQNWFKIIFFLVTSVFWALSHKYHSNVFITIAVFMTLLSLWMIAERVREKN